MKSTCTVLVFLVCASARLLAASFTTLDGPPGAESILVNAISGGRIVGSYAQGILNHGFVFEGSSYTIVDHPFAGTLPLETAHLSLALMRLTWSAITWTPAAALMGSATSIQSTRPF